MSNKCWFSFMPVADAILLTNHQMHFKEERLDIKQAQRQGWKCAHCSTVIKNITQTAYIPYIVEKGKGERSMAGYIACLPCNEKRKAFNEIKNTTATH